MNTKAPKTTSGPGFGQLRNTTLKPLSRGRLLRDLKLMFAALGAGTSVIPMGDNGRATRQLALDRECLNARP